jgi:hypothetical protein
MAARPHEGLVAAVGSVAVEEAVEAGENLVNGARAVLGGSNKSTVVSQFEQIHGFQLFTARMILVEASAEVGAGKRGSSMRRRIS